MAHYKQSSTHEKRPQDWNLEERLQALLDTGTFSPEALNAWCRERGLFAHQLAAWKAAFCQPVRGSCFIDTAKKVPGAVGGRGQMTSLPQRERIRTLIDEAVAAGARRAQACRIAGVSRRTLLRWQNSPQGDLRPVRTHTPHNRLSDQERQHILSVINRPEYGHLSPAQIVPELADQGQYLASESTLYRLLKNAGQLKHRNRQRPRQPQRKPRSLSASAPNEIYSWDITYLPAPIHGRFYYLYLFLDLFSRKIVGWQIYDTEDSNRASELIQAICQQEGISAGQVILHSDNGGPMKGATMLATLRELGIVPSFSRPAVSNDNPYSEALFRTLKYRPQYPDKPFASLLAARAWMTEFAHWYNTIHRHSAIRLKLFTSTLRKHLQPPELQHLFSGGWPEIFKMSDNCVDNYRYQRFPSHSSNGREHHPINAPVVEQAKEHTAKLNTSCFMRGKVPCHSQLLKLLGNGE